VHQDSFLAVELVLVMVETTEPVVPVVVVEQELLEPLTQVAEPEVTAQVVLVVEHQADQVFA
jgi:hypothetical protein